MHAYEGECEQRVCSENSRSGCCYRRDGTLWGALNAPLCVPRRNQDGCLHQGTGLVASELPIAGMYKLKGAVQFILLILSTYSV